MGATEVRHRKNWPFVKHYYFHIMDREWGHVTIRMCGYPPFGAQLILNGHEWVEREARRERAVPTDLHVGRLRPLGADLDKVGRHRGTQLMKLTRTSLPNKGRDVVAITLQSRETGLFDHFP
jgi:hypothetical protein